MGYKGQTYSIPLGDGGLLTDETPSRIPITHLLEATNVDLLKGVLEKAPGAIRYNENAFATGLIGGFDWWPNEIRQRIIAITRDGKVWKLPDSETNIEVLGAGDLVQGFTPVFVAGGAELPNNPRKLFIFTGQNQVQVISGDDSTRHNITTPAADWTTNYPTFGLMHDGQLVAMGNRSDPHRIYLSDHDDHEKFSGGTSISFSVAPGEGEMLLGGYVFNGRLFLWKFPGGVYYLDKPDIDPNTWSIKKLSSSFGVASPHAAVGVLNDLLVKNSTGSITSLAATEKFGDIESGDLLNNLRVEGYLREHASRQGTKDSYGLYYEDKKQVYYTYRSAGGIRNDSLLVLDYNRPDNPRVTWWRHLQPNFLALRQDSLRIQRPIYGAEDGYIYLMDQQTREINGAGYNAQFQIPFLDFGSGAPQISEQMKLYDFLELSFEETGNWQLSVDVFIDGRFSETIDFKLTKNETLDGFPLDKGKRMLPRMAQSVRKPLHGTGRRISFICYNDGQKQNFRLTGMTIYFRQAGQTQTE